MKKSQCNVCVGETQVEIDREPNNINDKFLCTECEVTLAYATDEWTKKLRWLPNIEFEKQVGCCIATIIEW